MKGSVGQALRDARLEKKLTVEEVARATKIRPERITDLENDDYTKFPNIAYSRSFLVLYAKFLGVDISRYPTVEVGNTVGMGDYQYLRGDEEGEEASVRRARTLPEQTGPPEKPRWLIAFFILLVAIAAGALIGWTVMSIWRLGPVAPTSPSATPTATPTPLPSPTATPAPATEATPSPSPEPEVRPAEPLAAEPAVPETVIPAEVVAPPTPAPTPPAAIPAAGEEREIAIRSTKKIRIRVVRDNPKSSSLYLGNINPAQQPLVYKGRRFWIKTAEPDALKVTIGGQPIDPGPESGVEIQKVSGL